MIAQLDLFAAPPPPAPFVARVTAAAAPALAMSPNRGTNDDAIEAAAIDAERAQRPVTFRDHLTHVPVDPKRLDKGGDVDKSYCADTLCNEGKLRSTFRLDGADWVNTGGLWWTGGRYCECYRVVPIELFDGPSAPYAQWDWETMREHAVGARHGMSAKAGSRTVVLVGPPIVVVAGQPEQSALL